MQNDLISRSALKSYIDCGHLRPPTEKCFSELDVVRMLDKQPTIDAEPVVHGRWLASSDIPDTLICSACGRRFDMYHFDQKDMPYCLCGAKMDGGTEG